MPWRRGVLQRAGAGVVAVWPDLRRAIRADDPVARRAYPPNARFSTTLKGPPRQPLKKDMFLQSILISALPDLLALKRSRRRSGAVLYAWAARGSPGPIEALAAADLLRRSNGGVGLAYTATFGGLASIFALIPFLRFALPPCAPAPALVLPRCIAGAKSGRYPFTNVYKRLQT